MSAAIVQEEPTIQTGAMPIFGRASYLCNKGSEYGWILSEGLALPFFIDKRLFLKRMVFTSEPIDLKNGKFKADSKNLWKEIVEFLHTQKLVDFIFKAQSNVVFKTSPDGATVVPWGTYEIAINRTDDELLESFHGKHRNVIRKAIKDGVLVRFEKSHEIIFEMIRNTVSRQKVPYFPSRSYLNGLLEEIPDNSLFVVSEINGQIQGCAVVLYDADRGYYMYGGSLPKPYPGSLNLLQFEIMKILREKGLHIYDLVGARIHVAPGSKQEGIQNFKMRFGATLRVGVAFRYVFNPIRYRLFNVLAKMFLFAKGMRYEDPINQIQRETE